MNDELRALAQEPGHRMKLVLDVSTRWNSTARMLRNFVSLEQPLRRFYGEPPGQDPDVGIFPFTQEEMSCLKDVLRILEHVERCTKRLSKEHCTLISRARSPRDARA